MFLISSGFPLFFNGKQFSFYFNHHYFPVLHSNLRFCPVVYCPLYEGNFFLRDFVSHKVLLFLCGLFAHASVRGSLLAPQCLAPYAPVQVATRTPVQSPDTCRSCTRTGCNDKGEVIWHEHKTCPLRTRAGCNSIGTFLCFFLISCPLRTRAGCNGCWQHKEVGAHPCPLRTRAGCNGTYSVATLHYFCA